jgi:PAS domain S-box-containing protein
MTRRILIANETHFAREVLAGQLREMGYPEQLFAVDGPEALELLTSKRADLVISDVHLPVLDGFQLCRLMRSAGFPSLNRIPVLLVSATFPDDAGSRLARDAGAQGFLQWPFPLGRLSGAVAKALAAPDGIPRGVPKVLVADDELAIARAVSLVLQKEGFEVMTVHDGVEAIRAGEHWRPDLVLTDYMMPKANGVEVLRWYRRERPEIPVVILTAHGSEELVVELMREGACDYLTKPLELRTVVSRCRAALQKSQVTGSPRLIQEMLDQVRRSEARYRAIFEQASDAIVILDGDGHVREANREAERVLGQPRTAMLGCSYRELVHPADHPRADGYWAQIREGRNVLVKESQVRRPDGQRLTLDLSISVIEVGGEHAALAVFRDITGQTRLERRLRQAEKLEALGRLAGGIAHDFNGMLSVILGQSGYLLSRIEPTHPCREDVLLIKDAGDRAAALTRQLLAFARSQEFRPEALDLNAVVAEIAAMLRRLVEKDVEISLVLGEGLGRVRADLGQIGQVLVNLALNARDAMPNGGRLTIETSSAERADPEPGPGGPGSPRAFVLLAVSDTGVGMDAETQAHLFEPFFTTKEPGKGTGLGLASVYGIVQQNGGTLSVMSEPEKGTRFEIYLPRV